MSFDWSEFDTAGAADGTWKPQAEGDMIRGTVKRVSIVDNQYGRTPVLVIDATKVIANGENHEIGEYDVWASQAMLRRRLAELRVDVGDQLAIAFISTQKLENGNTMKVFEVDSKPGDKAAPAPAAAGGDLW